MVFNSVKLDLLIPQAVTQLQIRVTYFTLFTYCTVAKLMIDCC